MQISLLKTFFTVLDPAFGVSAIEEHTGSPFLTVDASMPKLAASAEEVEQLQASGKTLSDMVTLQLGVAILLNLLLKNLLGQMWSMQNML